MWLTEDEFEDLLYIIRKKPVKSRGVNREEKHHRDPSIFFYSQLGSLVFGLNRVRISRSKTKNCRSYEKVVSLLFDYY
jgi:hypothetical protein